MSATFSRRAILGQIGLGLGLATSGLPARHAFAALDDKPWFFLTDAEAQWLAGVVDVFIPKDEFPSASEAGVVDFIDFQMATDYGQGKGLYLEGPFPEGVPEQGYQLPMTPSEMLRSGMEALLSENSALSAMSSEDRDVYVTDLSERDGMLGDTVPASTFFGELRSLTNQGYFADPIYLGNKDYAGWKMVGFPGAHAYYTESVDDHSRPYRKPPMGIAHDPGRSSTLPRVFGREG